MTTPDTQQGQMDLNKKDLEITNVRLGSKTDNRITGLTVSGAKLAAVAALPITPAAKPGNAVSKDLSVDGLFSLTGAGASFSRDTRAPAQLTVVAGLTPANSAKQNVRTDAAPASFLPTAPYTQSPANLLELTPRGIGASISAAEPTVSYPWVNPVYDRSPFGTPCGAIMTAIAEDQAMLAISLRAPCRPNTAVLLSHGKIRITAQTNHTGELQVLIPALDERAKIAAKFADGITVRAATYVPDLRKFSRLGFQWSGDYQITLTSTKPATVVSLGENTNGGAQRSVVISLPKGENFNQFAAEISATTVPTLDSCDKTQAISSFRTDGGRMISASGFQFKMPGCDSELANITLKNPVEGLMIAQN